jgi:D-glycero-alpha-D-manno-heptose 1-phosphate guanylyltransferase
MDNQTKIKTAIILAGGLGTRLRPAIGSHPKPLATILKRPFLQYLLDELQQQKVSHVVLAVGYKWQLISNIFGENYKGMRISYSIEESPLGTGGAICLAAAKIKDENFYVLNGDTFFHINLEQLSELHFEQNAHCTIALKKVANVDRYGTVLVNAQHQIIGFKEKEATAKGLINGGVYLLNKNALKCFTTGLNYSFETDYLNRQFIEGKIYGKSFENYFMDIGIPTDYLQFEKDILANKIKGLSMKLTDLEIDKTWTLFLDRDGVINDRLIDDYVKQLNELKIIKGVPQAIQRFSQIFGRIVVVTNQQGIGRGLMTAADLELIHGFIANVIENEDGRIDRFYFAPQLKQENSNYRKPGTGMGLHAKKEFPEINFEKSIMIGDSETDIEFGMKLGMKTIMLKKGSNIFTKADYIFEDLYQVSKVIPTN